VLADVEVMPEQSSQEGGFTLIELMVVVLIVAILLAIAIPTLLGSRSRANNRAAQQALRTSLTAELTWYSDHSSSPQPYADAATLATVEPALVFQPMASPVTASARVNQVMVDTGTPGVLILATKSGSGACYYIEDQSGLENFGTDTSCGGPSVISPGSGSWQQSQALGWTDGTQNS
jgi:type IV pilus assembly protein PilA